MNEISEIKIPKGVESISVTQHDDKIIIEFIAEKPKFKEGDFVYEDGRIMIVKSYPKNYHASIYPKYSAQVLYNSRYGLYFSEPTFRIATEEEKQILIDAIKKDGKRWNAEKLEIEDIPQPKFKEGDKVKIKDGISRETHWCIRPHFTSSMDRLIGKELTVEGYRNGFVVIDENHYKCFFAEDWLEFYAEEPKKGDLAIFWDDVKSVAIIKLYVGKSSHCHYDDSNIAWRNAIKFESKEQFEKVLRGEI